MNPNVFAYYLLTRIYDHLLYDHSVNYDATVNHQDRVDAAELEVRPLMDQIFEHLTEQKELHLVQAITYWRLFASLPAHDFTYPLDFACVGEDVPLEVAQ